MSELINGLLVLISQKRSRGRQNILITIFQISEEENHSDKDEDSPENVSDNEDPIQKYKMLLQDIEKKEEKKQNKDMEMEITWGLGIKDKAEALVQKKLNEGKFLTRKKDRGFILTL